LNYISACGHVEGVEKQSYTEHDLWRTQDWHDCCRHMWRASRNFSV